MARPFQPHFVGLFGLLCPLVVQVLDAMRLPIAIARVPPEFRNELLATLVCDLADRLRFGVVLAMIPDAARYVPACEDSTLGENMRVWFAAGVFKWREGHSLSVPMRSDVSYLCAANCLPIGETPSAEDYLEYFPPNYVTTLKSLDSLGVLDKMTDRMLASSRNAAIPLRLGKLDPKRIVGGRNLRLYDGPPYYLRNTDPHWWGDFSTRAIAYMSREAIARWSCIRDRRNNRILTALTPDLHKLDFHAADLFLKRIQGEPNEAEVYGAPEEDLQADKINDVRATSRNQDYRMLEWFEAKGLRVNPYTRWLQRLLESKNQSIASLDWKRVRTHFETFAPNNMHERDEIAQAKLCWCLSRLNPDQFPYSPRFGDEIGQTQGEHMLREWWQEVQLRQFEQYR